MIGQALIFGIIIFQILNMVMQWFFFKRKEFLYYILYLVLFIIYLYAYYEPNFGLTRIFNNDVEQIKSFTRIEGLLIFWSYVVFTRFFTDAEKNHVHLFKAMRLLENYLILGVFFQLIFFLLDQSSSHRELFSMVFYIPSFIYGLVIGARLLKEKVKLHRFIIIGSIFAILGSFIQGIVDNYAFFYGDHSHQSSLIMELGFIIEFIFLNIGFLYKTKVLQQQQNKIREDILQATIEKNEIAEQLYEVRNKLSMDLHDDISSSLGSIRILSELLTTNGNINNIGEGAKKILHFTEELSAKVNVLVWSFNQKNDTLERFVEYIQQYAENYTQQTNIACSVTVPDSHSAHFIVNGNVRKNIFMCIKEAMHNTLKYAKATKLMVSIHMDVQGKLSIEIEDNGIGLHPNNKLGNGMINMTKRMQSIGGSFAIESDNGTKIILHHSSVVSAQPHSL
jgi:signal transduction histidine kinase